MAAFVKFERVSVLCLLLLALAVNLVLGQQDYSCSPSKPCKLGCCGKNNVCGMGPDYCSKEKCISNCDSKSECNPGWGKEWSTRDKCPLNVCCSKFGFCGTTKDFCGSKKVSSPTCAGGTSANKRVIGYYEGWAHTKKCGGLSPEKLLYGAYTHLNYAFAFVNPSTFEIANMQDSDDEYMPRLTALKNYNPGLKVWVAVGGWSMNDPDQPTKKTFSQLAASPEHQKTFAKSLLSLMDKYGFDGVDLDWEYPVAEERSGVPEDFDNYVTFLKNLRGYLGFKGLSITLPASYWYLQHFDIKNMEQHLDWFNVMSYDLHGTWDGTNPYLGAYVNAHTNLTEIDTALNLLWRNDIKPEKVIMGMGFYGRSFTLSNPSCATAGCGFRAGGNPGKCSSSAGTLMYSEIKDIVDSGKAKVTTDKDSAVKIVTFGEDQWVSYDDEETLRMKMDYANKRCLGGIMVWAASTDDDDGTAIRALSKAAGRNDIVAKHVAAARSNDASKCVWGECGASCPAGLVPVASGKGNKDVLGIELGCNKSSRPFCCPAKDAPTCKWKGSNGLCGNTKGGRCSGNEVEIAAKTDGCFTGHKSLCCSKTSTDDNFSACKWFGAAPICATAAAASVLLNVPLTAGFSFASYGCGKEKDKPKELTTGKQGEGGQKSCLYNGGFKSYCCPQDPPWKDCKWRSGHTTWVQWKELIAGPLISALVDFSVDCKSGCEPGEVTVATDSFGCRSGTYSYFCCADPNFKEPPKVDYKLCFPPKNNPYLSHEKDAEAEEKNMYLETSAFDKGCAATHETKALRRALRSNATHGLDNSLLLGDQQLRALDERSLDTRGARAKNPMKLCNKIRSSNVDLYFQAHQSGSLIFKTTRAAYTVASAGVCAVPGIAALTKLDSSVNWVTEHVFEKQEFRDAMQSMIDGVTAKGNALKAGAIPFSVFDNNGLFQSNWPQGFSPSLSIIKSWSGTIADAFTGLLGRTSDAGLDNAYISNLQVCDEDFNAYKATIVAGVDFISQKLWDTVTDQEERVGMLTDIVDTFEYREFPKVIASYKSVYDNMVILWGDFAKLYTQSTGANYDFAGAYKEAVRDNLEYQVEYAQETFRTLLATSITYWNSNAATRRYSAQVVKDQQTKLAGFKTNLKSVISLPIAKMAPP
ncbi:Glycoside hydrolase, subgroup, catalytic core [Moelleriella libera RCEF 2490]|uniref:chitinase n=1 Tax=Moelleriella libera RCEF 2490 TaxID=1081109 RepID=A0A167VNJ5_9HYPO|nr:Glycoside hydrolase, subgroup, catalytic core [Moelleriella libera RCEF 2490]